MRKIGIYLAILSLCGCLCLGDGIFARAAEGGTFGAENGGSAEEVRRTPREKVEIGTPEELLGMGRDPSGDYVLTADIDMTGVSWDPIAFSGTFDGNGYSILNLKISGTGEGTEQTYDGNMKVYDTFFSGFFDTLRGAVVTDLKLVNLRLDVDVQVPCFAGGIAGYMEDSTIENCSVQGILQLRACDRMFGVGGVIGFGCGQIRNTEADVTLICIDTDASTKDEQFMGGVCGAGYPDIDGCRVRLSGYDSDHGYVHDGGLVGMYMFYPAGTWHDGSITDNRLTGVITFFEDNRDRRAYCSGLIGETMSRNFVNAGNEIDFLRDERYTYDVDLLPHSCGEEDWEETVTPPGCHTFGYTERRCKTCGYTETDAYTLKSHDLEWRTVQEATTKEPGLERGNCKTCDYFEERELAKITPTPEPLKEPLEALGESADTDGEELIGEIKESGKGFPWQVILLSVALAAAAGLTVLRIVRK